MATRIHARHFATLAAASSQGEYEDDEALCSMLAVCYPNIVRAIAWAIERDALLAAQALLGIAWWHSRVWNPATSWIDLATRLLSEGDLDDSILLRLAAKRCLVEARLAPSAATLQEAQRVIRTSASSARARADAHLALVAMAELGLGDLDTQLQGAAEAVREIHDWPDRDRVLANLEYGISYFERDFERARQFALDQLQIARSRGLEVKRSHGSGRCRRCRTRLRGLHGGASLPTSSVRCRRPHRTAIS